MLLAPLASGLAGLVWFLAFTLPNNLTLIEGSRTWKLAFGTGVVTIPFAFIAVLVLALPLHFLLRKFGMVRMRNYVIGGLIFGVVIALQFRGVPIQTPLLAIWCSLWVSATFGYFVAQQKK